MNEDDRRHVEQWFVMARDHLGAASEAAAAGDFDAFQYHVMEASTSVSRAIKVTTREIGPPDPPPLPADERLPGSGNLVRLRSVLHRYTERHRDQIEAAGHPDVTIRVAFAPTGETQGSLEVKEFGS